MLDQKSTKTILDAKVTTRAVLYARVSSERQASDDRISIEQQLADMKALCERQGWQITGIFSDKEKGS